MFPREAEKQKEKAVVSPCGLSEENVNLKQRVKGVGRKDDSRR